MMSDAGYARPQTLMSFNMATFTSFSNNGMTTLWRQRLRPWQRDPLRVTSSHVTTRK